ncbi:MAG: hypothetical protein JW772_00890 [Candidatus Diapherotrites archaeon]|nr:hypothetical protein [Candidatus Diapherotrites archaeon]
MHPKILVAYENREITFDDAKKMQGVIESGSEPSKTVIKSLELGASVQEISRQLKALEAGKVRLRQATATIKYLGKEKAGKRNLAERAKKIQKRRRL